MEQESTVCVRKLILQQLMVDGMCDEDCAKKTPSTQCCVGCDMVLQKSLSLWQPQSPHTKERRRYPALCYINGFVVYFCYVIYNKCYIPHLKLYCSKIYHLTKPRVPLLFLNTPKIKHHYSEVISTSLGVKWMGEGRLLNTFFAITWTKIRNFCINQPLLI